MSTIFVKNLDEFTSTIKKLEQEIEEKDGENLARLAYRGVCEKDGKRYLQPSIVRSGLCKYEYDMVQEMKRLNPSAFKDFSARSTLEKLQHYRFPTRLLDFTLSPYVALYFALLDESADICHKIYCMVARENNTCADSIALITERCRPYMFYGKTEDSLLENIIFGKNNDTANIKDKLNQFLILVFGKQKRPIFAYPQFYTEREKNQQSIFMIFCNKIIDRKGIIKFPNENIEKALDGQELTGRFVFTDEIYNQLPLIAKEDSDQIKMEIVIENTAVKELRAQLDKLGINESFLFPDNLEKASEQVIRKFQSRLK